MNIHFGAKLVDVGNLIVARGANFLLTVMIFGIVSKGLNATQFAEFGYWWSIAIMIGGVLLGGLSSGLVRVASVHGSLVHLLGPLRHAALALLAVAAALVFGLLANPGHAALALLLGSVALFGLLLQGQTAVLALLRAAVATRANGIASLLILVIVPLALQLMLGSVRTLSSTFLFLACAFGIGTLAACFIARAALSHLFAPHAESRATVASFLGNASSFTAVNIGSYAVVNFDFTLFRLIGTPDDFAVMATAKIFFERFVLPALMVFAGAVSLMVLRHRASDLPTATRIEATLNTRVLGVALVLISALLPAYWVFAHVIRGDARTIPLGLVACAAAGYLLYTVNGILLDLLVVRRSMLAVIAHVVALLLLGCAIPAMAIPSFGIAGWALGWLVFNVVVMLVLSRDAVILRRLAPRPTPGPT